MLTTEQIDALIQQHVDPVATYRKLHAYAHAIESAVRAAMPASPDVESLVPAGWKFYTADFSMLAADLMPTGNIMLIRDIAGKKAWNSLPEEHQHVVALHAFGSGETLVEAVRLAAADALAAGLVPSAPPAEHGAAT